MNEYDAERECGKPAVLPLLGVEFREWLAKLALDMETGAERIPQRSFRTLNWYLDNTPTTDVDECPFSDTVAITYINHIGRWTCPVCGYEHEEEAD